MSVSPRISWRSWLAGALAATVGIFATAVYLQWPRTLLHSWLLLAAAALLTFLNALLFSQTERRLKGFAVGFGALFVFLQAAAERLEAAGTIAGTGSDLVWLVMCVAGLTPSVGALYTLFVHAVGMRRDIRREEGRVSPRFVFWGSVMILLACWLPYLLAFYPGLFTYDISWQYQQYQEWNLNTHHPLLHTLLVGGFCELGWHLFGYPVKGLLMYTVFQMVLMALAMASAIKLLYKHRAPLWICVLILVCDAVLPFNTLLAISSTKDTLFAGAVLYLCVLLVELVLEEGALRRPGWMIRFVLAQAAVGLMRNNGFICLITILIVALIALIRYRNAARRLLALALCGLVLYGTANAGLKAATGAEEGHIREALSVPLQQLARVYQLTDDEAKSEIADWMPMVESYSPYLSDMVKNTFEGSREDLPELFQLWAEVGLRHPIIYLDSLLVTPAGFYHIDAMPTGWYLETSFHEDKGWWMLEDSKWPWLRDQMKRLYSDNEFLDVPVLSALLSPALWVWMLVLAFFTALYRRNRAVGFAGLVCGMLYLTALLGPCVMVRYVYPFMIVGPFLLGAVMVPENTSQTR